MGKSDGRRRIFALPHRRETSTRRRHHGNTAVPARGREVPTAFLSLFAPAVAARRRRYFGIDRKS